MYLHTCSNGNVYILLSMVDLCYDFTFLCFISQKHWRNEALIWWIFTYICLVLVLQHYYEEDDKVSAMETMRNAFEANSENVTAEGLIYNWMFVNWSKYSTKQVLLKKIHAIFNIKARKHDKLLVFFWLLF